mmetsp:Transcript_25513/g.21000  ORF Transcript_25513/g.21000 Transcript_25513/m.21000 type:complete len:138 (-) Transcript_25513:4-417(-)
MRLAAPRTLSFLPMVAPLVRSPLGLRCNRAFMSTEATPRVEEGGKKKVELPIDVYDNNKEWWEQITSPHDFMPKFGSASFTIGCVILVGLIMYNEKEESKEEVENAKLRQARLAAKGEPQQQHSPPPPSAACAAGAE